MAHTVVGVFDTSNEAQTALRQLVNSGISRDNIDIAPQTTSETSDDDDDDSISGFFRSLFGSDDKTDRYARYARKTGAIVTVHAKSAQEADQAADILDEYGAVNLDERVSATSETDPTRRDTTSRDTTSTDTTIPIIEEELHAGKRTVETGGVRVRSRIVDRPVEEHLRLREEHVHVERNKVNRPATEADMQNFKEGEMEITEHAEVPVVNKETRVVEEISLGKEVEEHDEAVRGTVRHTEVDIDNLDQNDPRRNTDPNDPRRTNDPNDPNRNRNL